MSYSYKNIWLISYPVMMSVLMEQLINITDAAFLGHVGEVELGASAIAGIYYLAVYMLGFGFSVGLQVVVARRNGEGDYSATGTTFFQGLWFLVGLSLLLFLLSRWLSPLILQRAIQSEEVRVAAMRYLDGRCLGLLFAFPALAFRAFFVGITKTRTLALNAVAMVAVNIGLNYLLVFGKGGFPPLGILGAALASTLSELVSLAMFTAYALGKVDRRKYGFTPVFCRRTSAEVLRVAVWSMLHSFIGVAPWFLFYVSIERLGRGELAISNIIRSISTLFFVIVSSFGSTTASLVGNLAGAGNREGIMPLCAKVVRLGYCIGIPLIFTTLIFHRPVIGIYTDDGLLAERAFVPFVVMLSCYLLSLPAFVYLNAVIGQGATRQAFTFQIAIIACYLSYLGLLNAIPGIPLAVYCTVEHFLVALLLLFSLFYLRRIGRREKA